MNLETQRLKIRPFNEKDTDFIINLLNQESFIKNIGDKGVRTTEQALDYLHSGPMKSYQNYGYGLSMVELKESSIPIGMCGILKREQLENPDIGYGFLPEYCSVGYAFEAADGCLKSAIGEYGLSKVWAVTNQGHEKSLKLLKKLDFKIKQNIDLYEDQEPCILLEYVAKA